MMKISLIDVGTPRDELNEPLGIEVLAGTLRDKFSTSVIVHMEYLQLSNGVLNNQTAIMDAHLIGISAGLYSLQRTEKLLDQINNTKYPNGEKPVVILGNLLGTFAYKEILSNHKDVICVRGEGEDALSGIVKTILDLPSEKIQTIKNSAHRADIPNLAFINKGKIVETSRRLVDLEKSAKPARDLLPLIIQKRGIVRVEASRGCPWGFCKFCAISAKYGISKWRPFPIHRVIEELIDLSHAGAKDPYYTDEDFMGSDPQRTMDIANSIILAKESGALDQELNFYVNMPIGAIIGDKEVSADNCAKSLRKLREAGLREVFVGIESGARTQIGRYGKKATAEKNIQALTILRKLGFEIDVGFIMFDPEMSLDDLKENLQFIRKANLVDHDARDIKKVRVEPGTKLEEELMAKDIIGEEFDVNSLTYAYKFRDSLVQRIFDMYEEWEKGERDVVYSIQGRSRGEILPERRRRLKKFLGEFRRLDFEFLETYTGMLEKSPGNLGRLETVTQTYREKRSRLLQKVPEYFESDSKTNNRC